MARLKNHPQFWLRDDAAASLDRLEASLGVISVNSAGRYPNDQQALINRWHQGGPKNRPPYLYKPQEPATASNHVKNGGQAVDTSHITLMLQRGKEFGWTRPFSGDPVHFEYNPAFDRHRVVLQPAGAINIGLQRQQDWLRVSRGETIAADGKAGPNTLAAFKRYQEFLKQYGYAGKIDGVWGQGTQVAHQKFWDAFNAPKLPASATGRPVVAIGARSDQVKILQERLNGRYPAYSKLRNDGVFGDGTKRVVVEFQRRAGLKADGVVGPKTWAALGL
jgi:peptidoglycan hydrolase-like protein with peptidoglycan-binding domain